jgi:Transposase IS4
MNEQEQEKEMNHGTRVLLDLISPWWHSNRIVCADSYFSSVQTALKCKACGIKYIGVVKTATKQYPMAHLGKIEMKDKGDRYAMVARDENGQQEFLAFVWRDRERRYFIHPDHQWTKELQ